MTTSASIDAESVSYDRSNDTHGGPRRRDDQPW
jgi:hypothetical protein